MHPLLIASIVMFAAACLTYFNVKRIAADIYIKTVRVHEGINDDLPASPYSIEPAKSTTNVSGFTILKNGKLMKLAGTTGAFTVYADIESAIKQMNKYEKLDRVRLTTLD